MLFGLIEQIFFNALLIDSLDGFEEEEAIPAYVSLQDNLALLEMLTEDEIFAAISALWLDAALGLDGFPNYFYTEFWNLIMVFKVDM